MAANETWTLGHGGIAVVSRATGLSIPTIRAGWVELEDPETIVGDRIRRPGSGRKPLAASDATLVADLDALIEPATRGDPECPLRWTSKSMEKLARELPAEGHSVSPSTVATLLHDPGHR